jgi:multicomponent Na+:H+ antiporter subunit G
MHAAAVSCVAAGTGLVVVCSILALVTRGGFFVRLHLLTPVTSLAGPLIGIGLVLANGVGFTAAQIVVIVVGLAAANPALQAATARLGAIEVGRATAEPTE